MKTLKQLMIVAVSATIVFSSCTVEKRRYMDGYHVEFFGKKDKAGKVENTKNEEAVAQQAPVAAPTTVAVETPVTPVAQQVAPAELTASVKEEVVITRSAQTVTAVAPLTKEEVKAAASEVKSEVKEKKSESKANAATGGKSQLIAAILWFLVGGLGIHRFYMGYIWQGVVQLLTAGGCGIWWLIDGIRILTGSLQPKDGSWDTTFDDL